MPDDPVAGTIAEAIMLTPADPLREQLRAANANRRTIERRFNTETVMSLGKWRLRARSLASIESLADGETDDAVTVGHPSPSAFVAAFRAEPGTSVSDH
jgi:AraC-like DNA-binding protein